MLKGKDIAIKIMILIIVILLILIVYTIFSFYGSNQVIKSDKFDRIVNSNSLTMMYETESGSGEYVLSSDTTWPESGYTFNENLSKCENGGILSWNSETNRVIMQTSGSDKCYVYFDVYEPLVITSYDISLSCGPMNYLLDVVANREVDVSKYVLELDNGKTMETQNLGYLVWLSYSSDGSQNFTSDQTYSYNLYLVTVDGEESERVSGTLNTGNEVCGKPAP